MEMKELTIAEKKELLKDVIKDYECGFTTIVEFIQGVNKIAFNEYEFAFVN